MRMPLLTKKSAKCCLRFVKDILIILETLWKIFCGPMRQKLNFLHLITSAVRLTQHFIKKDHIKSQTCGGSLMVCWTYFHASMVETRAKIRNKLLRSLSITQSTDSEIYSWFLWPALFPGWDDFTSQPGILKLFKRQLAKEHLTKILVAIYVYVFDPVLQ